MNPTIGISGVATSGKDTFGKLLIEDLRLHGYNPRRFALADQLKKQVAPFILKEYGIDIFNCSMEEKNLVRPMLVAHGEIKRKTTEGTYWLDLLDKEIEEEVKKQADIIPIITDVRYAYYPNDEFFWIKQKRHGLVVHVERYTMRLHENVDEVEFEEREVVRPANEVEAKHDGALRTQADYPLTWQTCPIPNACKGDVEDWCRGYVAEFRSSPLMKEFLKRCYHPRSMI